MKKIVIFMANWGSGGIETNYLNILEGLKSKFDISICCFGLSDDLFLNNLKKIGVKIKYFKDIKKTQELIPLKERLIFLRKFVCENQVDIIHINVSNGIAFLYGAIIKKYSPKTKVIIHGHGDGIQGRFIILKKILYGMSRILFEKKMDYFIGCTDQIKEWMFSKSTKKKNNCITLKNAINVNKYKFNNSYRNEIKSQLKIGESLVIGTVGRIDEQKNPLFILDIIEKLNEKKVDFSFIWIGKGALENIVKTEAKKRNIDRLICWIDSTNSVEKYYSAMDIFILPSLYEGLGIVNVEAQASGLKVIVSTTTPRDAIASDNIFFLPINLGCECWVNNILNSNIKNSHQRVLQFNQIKKFGWNIEKSIEQYISIYEKLLINK